MMAFFGKNKILSKDEIEKLGQAIIYIAKNTPNLSKTKILKLIYLMDEISIKKYGIPIFNINYKVWQAGPVNVELFSTLSDGEGILIEKYFEVSNDLNGYIKPKVEFSDDEFTENEMGILNLVIESFGAKTAFELVDICHKRDSLWYKISFENGLLEAFENKQITSTDYTIDFSEYLGDVSLQNRYKDYTEFVQLSREFKN